MKTIASVVLSLSLSLALAVALWPTLVPLVLLLGVVVAGEWVGRRARGGW